MKKDKLTNQIIEILKNKFNFSEEVQTELTKIFRKNRKKSLVLILAALENK